MTLVEKPLAAFLEELRSSAPTPGGGSAAALAGSLGASLLVMVSALPRPRAGTEHELERLRAAGSRAADLARRLEALIDADSLAYDTVMSAYSLPRGTDDEKARRSARIQEALKDATETPLEMIRACAAALAEEPVVRELSNPNAASDVGVARELLLAGLRGARLNVDINLESVSDQEYVARVREEVAALAQ
jgi:methenyltetrahydrofolate cyclohydrolase